MSQTMQVGVRHHGNTVELALGAVEFVTTPDAARALARLLVASANRADTPPGVMARVAGTPQSEARDREEVEGLQRRSLLATRRLASAGLAHG